MKDRIPEKCAACEFHKVVKSVEEYSFCRKMNVSFCGREPKTFFACNEGVNNGAR